MKIAFWNINKKELSDLIVMFTVENDIDILYLAEVEVNTVSNFLHKINLFSKTNQYKRIDCSKDKIILFSRYSDKLFDDKSSLYKSSRLVAHKIKIPETIELNLVGIHFHSKNNWSDSSLAMECATVSNSISIIESESNNPNTIVIGDFNMNPFEIGMIATNGLHAIPDLEYAARNIIGREVDDTYYPFFYNPMWNFFGDNVEPFGTFYYRSSGNVSYEWHVFDQVLIRPTLRQHLEKDCIKIVTKIENDSLINSMKRPDSSD